MTNEEYKVWMPIQIYISSGKKNRLSLAVDCFIAKHQKKLMKCLNMLKRFLCKMPKGGISEQFFREYFKDFDTVELW